MRDFYLIFGYALLGMLSAIVGGLAYGITALCALACFALLVTKETK